MNIKTHYDAEISFNFTYETVNPHSAFGIASNSDNLPSYQEENRQMLERALERNTPTWSEEKQAIIIPFEINCKQELNYQGTRTLGGYMEIAINADENTPIIGGKPFPAPSMDGFYHLDYLDECLNSDDFKIKKPNLEGEAILGCHGTVDEIDGDYNFNGSADYYPITEPDLCYKTAIEGEVIAANDESMFTVRHPEYGEPFKPYITKQQDEAEKNIEPDNNDEVLKEDLTLGLAYQYMSLANKQDYLA